jgi:hypothetical protein
MTLSAYLIPPIGYTLHLVVAKPRRLELYVKTLAPAKVTSVEVESADVAVGILKRAIEQKVG